MRALSKIFMILFLCAFVAARTITILNFSPSPKAVILSQKTSTSSKTDALIYDEKEKEKEEENAEPGVQDFFIASFVPDLTLLSLQDKGTYQSYYAPRTCGDATDIPVYLAKRALLI